MYMGMSSGWPQPIIITSVGGVRVVKREGGMEEAKVRRYSWQFCTRIDMSVEVLHRLARGREGRKEEGVRHRRNAV